MRDVQDLLSGTQAAIYLGISQPTMSRWVAEGKLRPHVRIHGRLLFFTREDLMIRMDEMGQERLDRAGRKSPVESAAS